MSHLPFVLSSLGDKLIPEKKTQGGGCCQLSRIQSKNAQAPEESLFQEQLVGNWVWVPIPLGY